MKKGAYLTHLDHMNGLSLILWLQVKGSWKIKTKTFQRIDSKDKGFKY